MSTRPFAAYPYDRDRLITLLAGASYRRLPDEIAGKRHTKYFDDYLTMLGAKTVVAEPNYIDRDFLEDFAAYYVRCFPNYRKECTRLHFFSHPFTQEGIEACLAGDESTVSRDSLARAYLGFVVVKPLPQTVIGRTCLATYPKNPTRHLPTAQRFTAHFFGIPLEVAETLPFQEQDSVVAACATSALWTLFQATSRHHYHELLSPVEITRAATHLLPAESRVLPNRGLSTHMMAQAIKSVNLEPLLVKVAEPYILQAAIYSYVHAKIPLILGVALKDDLGGGRIKDNGKHALAVVGYNLGGALAPIGPSGLLLRASRIDKIYVHDDQVGPFARMALDGRAFSDPALAAHSLSTSWPSENAAGEQMRAIPDVLLVPLYHKVRISWEWVHKTIVDIDTFLKKVTVLLPQMEMHALEWDVYLTTVNEVKADLLKDSSLSAKQRLAAVTRSMPRFIWRATAFRRDQAVIDVLFDATDIHTADALVQALVHEDFGRGILREMAEAPDFETSAIDKGAKPLLRWVRANYL